MSDAPAVASVPATADFRAERSSAQLRRNLLDIGHRVGQVRGIGALRWALMLASFLALTWGLIGGLLATGVYEHRAEISRARTPVSDDGGPVRWGAASTSVEDRIVAWIALEQVTPGTDPSLPLPAGVPVWPEPGQAVISPALAELLEDEGVPDRFGEVIAVLDESTLASPGELIVYARSPLPWLNERDGQRVSGFGVGPGEPYDSFTGEVLYDRSVMEFWSLAVLLMWLPGLLAAFSAARVADSATRRRHVLLARLGAGRRHRMLIALPPALSAAAASVVVSAVGLTWLATGIRRIPLHGFLLDGAVVRGMLPVLAAAALLMPLIGVALVAWISAGRLGSLDATRLTVPPDQRATVRSIALLVTLAAQPWLVGSGNLLLAMAGTVVGAAVVVLCLPGALADLARLVARRRARRALATGHAGAFVAWRMTAARPQALARLAGALAGLVIIVAHAVVVMSLFLGPDVATRQVAAQVGEAAAEVELEVTDDRSAREARRLADEGGLVPLRVDLDFTERSAQVIASCPGLQELGIACENVALAGRGPVWLTALLDWYAIDRAEVVVAEPDQHVADPDSTTLSMMLLSDPGGGAVDVERFDRDAYLSAEVPLGADRLFGGWLRGAADLVTKASWVYVFGVPGVMVLLLVGALTWAAVTIEETQRVLASPVLSGQREVLDAVALIRIAVPVALGGVAGALLSGWLLMPHVSSHQLPLPWGFLTAVLLATALASLAAGIAGRRLLGGRRET